MRVLLADDHEIVRSGFRSLLERQSNVKVVGEASDGHEAIRLARKLTPDVIVMDVAMPGLNGIDATRRIIRDRPEARVLALSMHPSQRVVADMLRAGAAGYLLKTCALEELVQAVHVIHSGRKYLSPDITGSVVEGYLQEAFGSQKADGRQLSNREREVLQLVAEGQTTKEIAAVLCVSVKTVEAHRHKIMEKLDIRSIAELTKYAVREGLTPLDT